MKVVCKPIFEGIMVVWEAVPQATRYIIKLYLHDEIISLRTNEITELYHSFKGLGDFTFYVQVESEGRDGVLLEKSTKVKSDTKTEINTHYNMHIDY